ncbi:MAG TPA: Dyp-type peroxidase, partial [Solirubrobacter sp.]
MPGASEPRVRVGQIQGNVVPGFNTGHQRLVGLRIEDPKRARRWLQDGLGKITTCAHVRDERPSRQHRDEPLAHTWRNLCFSHRGLGLLGTPELERIHDPWFRDGMWAVAGALGDDGHDGWAHGTCAETTPDVLAILADNDEGQLDQACERLIDDAQRHRLKASFVERGARHPEKLEAFGFRDGVSIPAVRGYADDTGDPLSKRRAADDPLAARWSRADQALVWPGQAVFGYHGQSSTDPLAHGDVVCGGPRWMVDGSYLVFRRLVQDVGRFERFLEQAACRMSAASQRDVKPVQVAALLVGRWPNGNPLVRDPDGDQRAIDGANVFGYMADTPACPATGLGAAPADLDGDLCPHFAHIRKVNPRDAGTDMGTPADTLLRLLLRRGIPFGPPLIGGGDPAAERGLMFLGYGATIEDQFEFITRRWINSALHPRFGGRDPLIGADRPWVTPTGGGYFFAP